MAFRVLLVATAIAFASGCTRDPRDAVCPSLQPGDLVLTELRGDQVGSDDVLGQWFELHNPTGTSVNLAGLAISFRRLDGSAEAEVVIRHTLNVGPGDYVVLGKFAESATPVHVDYGYLEDLSGDLYDAAAVEVRACDVLVDRAVYRDLPDEGSLSLDGTAEPDATENDDEAGWCIDTAGAGAGTPGERNPPCA
jgi:hypothetical protein